jgi:hypothetical protein
MVLDHSDKPITQELVKNRLMAEYNRRQLEIVSSKTTLVVSSKPNQIHGELICGYCKKNAISKGTVLREKLQKPEISEKQKLS